MAKIVLLAALAASSLLAQDWARAQLDKSPRHREWVTVKHGGRSVETFVVYPESKDKTPVVLVIHEIFGMTDWVQDAADQFAAAVEPIERGARGGFEALKPLEEALHRGVLAARRGLPGRPPFLRPHQCPRRVLRSASITSSPRLSAMRTAVERDGVMPSDTCSATASKRPIQDSGMTTLT